MGNKLSYKDLTDEFLRADLGFVDGHPDTRAECVTALFDKCAIIVAHDLDLDGNHYEKVLTPQHYSFYKYTELSPHTGVWFDNGYLDKQKIPVIYRSAIINAIAMGNPDMSVSEVLLIFRLLV